MNAPSIESLGDGALLVRLGDRIGATISRSTLELAEMLAAAAPSGVIDIAPAYASVTVRYDVATFAAGAAGRVAEHAAGWIERLLHDSTAGARPAASPHPDAGSGAGGVDAVADIPVCYGGEFGPDLDAIAATAGLDASAVIALHAGGDYRVAMLGFMPGFPYLLGLDPALRAPRRASPRTRVPAGSVAIGGAQTGIYPRELPGGWQLIGRTPLVLFDPRREPAALLHAGQRVRFRAIDAAEFAAAAP